MGWLRNMRRQREKQSWRDGMADEAPRLGMTPEEWEESCATDAIQEQLGIAEIHTADERIQGGVPMVAEDWAYWWHDGRLYTVGEHANNRGLPAAPADVTETAVRKAVTDCGCVAYMVPMGSRIYITNPFLILRRIFGRGRTGPWDDVKHVSAELDSYQHTAQGYVETKTPERTERIDTSVTLHFQRPDLLSIDWNTTNGDRAESGWIRAMGSDVRYYATRDGKELDCFTLNGAICRAHWALPSERDIFSLLLPYESDCRIDEEEYRREEAEPIEGTPCYRLVHEREGFDTDEDGSKVPSRSKYTIWVDAGRHAVLRRESTYECGDFRMIDTYDIKPCFNAPIDEGVWAPPRSE